MSLTFGNVQNTDFVYTETTGTAASLVANLPPISAGDLLVIVGYANTTTNTLNTPAGFSNSTTLSSNSSGFVGIWHKEADGSETTATLTLSSGTFYVSAIAFKVTGYDGTTPVNVASISTATGGSNWNSPAVTPTVNNGLLFIGGGATGVSDWLSADEPDTSTLVYQEATAGSWLGLAFETLGGSSSGVSTGTRLWTNAVNGKRTFSFVIAPSTGPTVGTIGTIGTDDEVIQGETGVTFQLTGATAAVDTVTVGGAAATVTGDADAGSGVRNVTITVPAGAPLGTQSVVVTLADAATGSRNVTVVLPVQVSFNATDGTELVTSGGTPYTGSLDNWTIWSGDPRYNDTATVVASGTNLSVTAGEAAIGTYAHGLVAATTYWVAVGEADDSLYALAPLVAG